MSEEKRQKFQIKCTEKAQLPNTFETCPMRLSTLAEEVVNVLFKTYSDYAGCKVQGIQAYSGSLPMITTDLFFSPNPNAPKGAVNAFYSLYNKPEMKDAVGPISRQRRIDNYYTTKSRNFGLTEEGADGIEPYILYSMQKNWKKTCVAEIVDTNTYMHKEVYSVVHNIDIIKCIEEFCGTTIVREDGTKHRVMYGIEMKRPLSSAASTQSDWLVEVITGDITNFETLGRDLGMNFSAQSSLNITRV